MDVKEQIHMQMLVPCNICCFRNGNFLFKKSREAGKMYVECYVQKRKFPFVAYPLMESFSLFVLKKKQKHNIHMFFFPPRLTIPPFALSPSFRRPLEGERGEGHFPPSPICTYFLIFNDLKIDRKAGKMYMECHFQKRKFPFVASPRHMWDAFSLYSFICSSEEEKPPHTHTFGIRSFALSLVVQEGGARSAYLHVFFLTRPTTIMKGFF
jgi:hypothetical protein